MIHLAQGGKEGEREGERLKIKMKEEILVGTENMWININVCKLIASFKKTKRNNDNNKKQYLTGDLIHHTPC